MALYAAHRLIRLGYIVYSPIIYTHWLSLVFRFDRSWQQWRTFDTCIISRSSAVIVLAIKGWDVSQGVGEEIAQAQDLGLPVFFVTMIQLRRGTVAAAVSQRGAPKCLH